MEVIWGSRLRMEVCEIASNNRFSGYGKGHNVSCIRVMIVVGFVPIHSMLAASWVPIST